MTTEKTFWNFFKETVKEHYKAGYLFWLLLFLTISVFINFYFNFEKALIYPASKSFTGVIYYIIFYCFAYFSMFLLVVKKQKRVKNSKKLILTILGVVLSLSISAVYFYLTPILDSIENRGDLYLIRKILVNSRNIIFVALPALILWKQIKEPGDSFFWFSFKKVKFKTYLLFLLPVIGLAFAASFLPSFLKTYPTFKVWNASDLLGISKNLWAWLYELLYGFDFVWVEFLFRGVLVIGLYKILGKDAIIPMVSMYCFLHFGKPLGEAISSVFGGYFLGVLAIYSRSIVGGCFLHIGVALSMDIFALIRISCVIIF